MQRTEPANTSRACLLLAAVATLPAACTSESKPAGPGGRQEIAVWDFPAVVPAPPLRLWPMDPGSPKRKKRALTTNNEEGRLAVVVDGRDPGLSWDFESPTATAFVHIEVEAMAPGALQLFYATSRCPVFSEACSLSTRIGSGKNIVNFMLDPALPLRALRLDAPDVLGARFWFDRILLRTGAATDAPFVALGPTAIDSTSTGLRLEATGPDPGMTVETPGLEASRVTALELVLRGSANLGPQLFWDGPCGAFSEACSALLPRVDAGALTHRVVLGKQGKWTGRIGALRLDPGPDAGEYVFERIALVHDPAD